MFRLLGPYGFLWLDVPLLLLGDLVLILLSIELMMRSVELIVVIEVGHLNFIHFHRDILWSSLVHMAFCGVRQIRHSLLAFIRIFNHWQILIWGLSTSYQLLLSVHFLVYELFLVFVLALWIYLGEEVFHKRLSTLELVILRVKIGERLLILSRNVIKLLRADGSEPCIVAGWCLLDIGLVLRHAL